MRISSSSADRISLLNGQRVHTVSRTARLLVGRSAVLAYGMEFSDEELLDIERACNAQSRRDRESAALIDRPMMRDQRDDSADRLSRIVARIQQDRRARAVQQGRGDD
jgi:hypothetical protein